MDVLDNLLMPMLTVFAILTSPLVALWIQSKLDSRKEKKGRRLHIYKTLMATRAMGVSQEHVNALNMIDLEFEGEKYNSIQSAWKGYLDARNLPIRTQDEVESFHSACDATLTTLLAIMGKALGYTFDEAHIKKGIYRPQGHVTEENFQVLLKGTLLDFLSGKCALPMTIVAAPEELAAQKKLRDLAIQFFEQKLAAVEVTRETSERGKNRAIKRG